ncbi:MAG: cytochrome c3 family protein [Desulfobacterales bacterium]
MKKLVQVRFIRPLHPIWTFGIMIGCCMVLIPALAHSALSVTEAKWNPKNSTLEARGESAPNSQVDISDAETRTQLGTAVADRKGNWRFRLRNPEIVPCQVSATSEDFTIQADVAGTPGDCGTATPPSDPETVTGSHAGRFSAYEGTRTCLECHATEAMEVHSSVHYQWKGDASEAVGLSTDTAGKLGGINDFCIYPDINWIGKLTNTAGNPVDGGCAKCHAGLGDKPQPEATQEQLENIDCLVCHSDGYKRTVDLVDGRYRFVPDSNQMAVSILQAASDITRPGNDSCLNCHTKAGGGNNFKRGDIEEAHRNASRDFDVHLASAESGGAGLQCTDCHTSVSHKIAGRGVDLRPRDSMDEVSCAKCHTEMPHYNERLDRHTARVDCTACHIPTYAKAAPTDMLRDWSQPGDPVEATGLYEPHHEKGLNVTPVYRFFNGTSTFYEFGAEAIPGDNGRITMAGPVGDVTDPNAKIHAFKYHVGNQPIDPYSLRLLPLKIGKFFESGRIDEAVELGAEAVGWGYQGHDFAETERYLGLFHEVAPKEQALDCNSCHGGGRMDFAALGYTPNETRNGRALCASCHGEKSDEWQGREYFFKIHDKHVKDKKIDCSQCHGFSSAN